MVYPQSMTEARLQKVYKTTSYQHFLQNKLYNISFLYKIKINNPHRRANIFQMPVWVGAILVLMWLPVLCCAMIWILLYRYIFMDFIGWTDKDFFPSLLHHQRERCTAWASIDRNRMVFASNTRSTFKYILTDLCFRTAHKLGYNNFPKCNLCGNISKSVNGRLLTVGSTRSLFTMLEILEEKYKYWIRGRGLIWMNILRELFRKL